MTPLGGNPRVGWEGECVARNVWGGGSQVGGWTSSRDLFTLDFFSKLDRGGLLSAINATSWR